MSEMTVGRLPFHEAIVVVMKRASSITELKVLGCLLVAAKIPKGHDEIVTVWNAKCASMGWQVDQVDAARRVAVDVLQQKQEVEVAAAMKAAAGAASPAQAVGVVAGGEEVGLSFEI